MATTSRSDTAGTDALRAWARSGLMSLTGDVDGPPLAPSTTILSAVDEAAGLFGADHSLLTGRAALMGLTRRGRVTCGGAGRILRCADGWVAMSLPREDDLSSVPALLMTAVPGDPWDALQQHLVDWSGDRVVERAGLLGLAAARVGAEDGAFVARNVGPGRADTAPGHPAPNDDAPVVLDLSALWAGPLCSRLLGSRGARVIKVESLSRPDGARRGNADFYDLLNASKASVALDLTDEDGRMLLRRLVEVSDIVITSGRRRAIHSLGLDPHEVLSGGRTRVFVAVTAYGWDSDRVGFGDDAAAAAGLVAWDEQGSPRFAGDALADPLCGILAAAEAWRCWERGGSWFLDASLVGAARSVTWHRLPAVGAVRTDAGWEVHGEPVADPPLPSAGPRAAPLGADTERILAALEEQR